jgi:hypothetical protein
MPPGPPYPAYRIAGRDTVTDMSLAELAAFVRSTPGSVVRSVLPLPQVNGEAMHTVYDGPGWVGNAWRQVRGTAGAQGYGLEIDGIGTLHVSSDGKTIRPSHLAALCNQGLLMEALLGPALILALALDSVFCLHASAAALDGQLVAFVGGSGSGKSTLARYLDTQRSAGWRRVADDILPLAVAAARPEALPHFPQLKMPPEHQPARGQPERIPLAGIVLLESPGADADGIRSELVGARQTALTLVRHTVASRLFDSPLLARHLAFCTSVAGTTPLWRFRYPHQLALLPHIADRLQACLAQVRRQAEVAL